MRSLTALKTLKYRIYLCLITTGKHNAIYFKCRSVWYYPLRLDAPLYIEVVFNQIAPDYLEGLLLVLPGEHLPQEVVVSFFFFCTSLYCVTEGFGAVQCS